MRDFNGQWLYKRHRVVQFEHSSTSSHSGPSVMRSLDPTIKKQIEKSKPKNGTRSLAALRAANAHHPRAPTSGFGSSKSTKISPSSSTTLSQPSSSTSSNAQRNALPSEPRETLSSSSSASNTSIDSYSQQAIHDRAVADAKRKSQRSSSTPIRAQSPTSRASPPPLPMSQGPNTPSRRSMVPPSKKRVPSSSSSPKMKKLTLLEMLKNDDPHIRCDGIVMLAHKMSHADDPDSASARARSPRPGPSSSSTVNQRNARDLPEDDVLVPILITYLSDPSLRVFEMLMGSEGIRVLSRVVPFDIVVPTLLLISDDEEKQGKKSDEQRRIELAQRGLRRLKTYLGRRDRELGDKLLKCLSAIGGAGGPPRRAKKDEMSVPLKRKVTRGIVEWMDEIVKREVGLYEDEEVTSYSTSGGGLLGVVEDDRESVFSMTSEADEDPETWLAGEWFQDDVNVKQYLNRLLPVLTKTPVSSVVHTPLVLLIAHLRLVNEKVFETVVFTFDEDIVGRVGKQLGVTLRRPGSSPVKGRTEGESGWEVEERVREVMEEDQKIVVEEAETMAVMEVEKERKKVERETETKVEVGRGTETKVEEFVMEETAVVKTHAQNAEVNDVHMADGSSILSNILPALPTPPAASTSNSSLSARSPSASSSSGIMSNHQNGSGSWSLSNATMITEEPLHINDARVDSTRSLFLVPSTPPPASGRQDWSKLRAHSFSITSDPVQDDVVTRSTTERRRRSLPPSSPFGKGGMKDKAATLGSILERLDAGDVDATMFRKLVRLSKDVPVDGPDRNVVPMDVDSAVKTAIRTQLANESGDGAAVDVWGVEGEKFAELVEALIGFLEKTACAGMVSMPGEKNTAADHREKAIMSLKHLLLHQIGLFHLHYLMAPEGADGLQMKVMRQLLECRSDDSNDVCSAAEDALDTFFAVIDPNTSFDVLLTFLESNLDRPSADSNDGFVTASTMGNGTTLSSRTMTAEERMRYYSALKYHPVGSAFMYLAKVVKRVPSKRRVEESLLGGGVEVFTLGINSAKIQLRKSCVDALVAFYQVLGDELYEYLKELREDQISLVNSYAARAAKKAESIGHGHSLQQLAARYQ
ncbi:hypothetical protein BC936DRAFT_138222 [Jimgerdemannia flammicorona]|uniref:Uncharacterized protein n=1 Tax=Jimgerdemannia flammicorona TaxID=994334 RepID=A0A433CW19_9FUNG|nr:hypothetical protein BC936DRAFT_138222 [Jimgerdemannia flammicorona]